MANSGRSTESFARTIGTATGPMAECMAEARAFLLSHGVGPRAVYGAELAIEELVGNVIRHGHGGSPEHWVSIAVGLEADTVVVTVEDDAPAFDPTRAREPQAPASVANAAIGGLGLKMLRRTSVRMEYDRMGDRNRVRVWIASD